VLHSKPKLAAAGFVVLCAVFFAAWFVPLQANAGGGGAVGGGGTGGGGGGGGSEPQTKYGYGWYQFTVDSSTHPKDLRNNTSWANSGINGICKSLGAKYIIAYVVYRQSGGINNSMVYNYVGWADGWPGWKGGNGLPWMTTPQAKAKYNSADFDKTGYTWGTNIGWFCYDFANNWTINGQSYIQEGPVPNKALAKQGTITAAPGDKLNWYHDLRNNGPDNMDKQTHYQIDKTGFSNGWNAIKTPTAWASGTDGSLFVSIYATKNSPYTKYTVTQNDVGKTLCERISWTPASSASSGTAASGYACARIPFNYTLQPQISTSPSPLLREDIKTIQVTASVINSGGTRSDNVNWSVTRFVVAPGGTYTIGATAAAPCTQISGYMGGSCQTIKNGTTQFALGTTYVPGPGSFADTIPNGIQPGSRVCYVTSVDKGSTATPTWKHSSISCSMIERVPFVQVLGNDLRVGSTFSGTNINAGATSFVFSDAGSWAEYGILAPGNISNLASESGANGGNGGAPSAWSGLTFANTGAPAGCSSGFGCYAGASSLGKIPGVSSFVKTAQYNGAPLNYDQGSASFKASDIPGIIAGSNIANFTKSASITTTGTITIDQDITYNPGSLTSSSDIPQLILIADNINITGNVKHIDAWLVASNTINTCSDVAQLAIRSTNCSNQLTVNGAIMANQLLLDRTYHDQAQPTEPSEKLNLRADSYIWSSNIARQNGQWQTVYSTDLPPRF
jgi:hypothetical protein